MYIMKKLTRLQLAVIMIRLQTFARTTSYIYGVSVTKVCKTELLSKYE